ncbi:MAG: hypothetical protein RLY86_3945 [Pseudomonadota bacterium]|jgi:hypothetical protein
MIPTMPHRFDRFIGIDWTGASPAKGIAIAVCDRAGVVTPVPSPGRHWRRREAVDWLAGEIAAGDRLLIGIDCAFGLPIVPGVGYLDGRVPGVADMIALWDLVEGASAGAPDHFAGPAVLDPRLAPSFWISGTTPAHWGDGSTKRRMTEVAAAAGGLGTPVSVFKLAAAAKQVGKASLAGMRSLRALRAAVGPDRLSVWPVEEPGPGRSVVVEIYPTLFRKAGGHGVRKITDRAALAPAAATLGATLSATVPDSFDDHLGDALISAAGLRLVADRPEVWHPPGMTAEAARAEGWIFGVV